MDKPVQATNPPHFADVLNPKSPSQLKAHLIIYIYFFLLCSNLLTASSVAKASHFSFSHIKHRLPFKCREKFLTGELGIVMNFYLFLTLVTEPASASPCSNQLLRLQELLTHCRNSFSISVLSILPNRWLLVS